MNRELLLEDTLTFKTVPWLVKVEREDVYCNVDTGEVRGINVKGHPVGMGGTPSGWKKTKALVARVRPDYPYTIDREWPENVDKHFQESEVMESFEKRKGFLKWGYRTEEREPERTPKELANDVVEKMKEAYKNRTKVKSL